MNIPLCTPSIGEGEYQSVEEVLESGWLAHGPKNEEFEDQFTDFIGVDHAVTMNSCTSALFLAVKAKGITGEVLVPSFTFVASANAIETAGATPVFVDINRETRNVDPESLAAAVTHDTEAVMVVHYGGQSCEMDEILEIVDRHDLELIEDSAETIGGEYKGQKTGSFGIGCFSFYPTKNITTGEGGILTTNDSELAKRVRNMVGHGIPSSTLDREKSDRSWYRAATQAGFNFRMSNLHAAIGVEQMKRIEQMNTKRRELADKLTDLLELIDGINPPRELDDRRHVYQMYTILTDDHLDRDQLVEELNNRGVGASVHFYPPVHQQPRYENREYRNNDLTVTEEVSDSIITLPLFPQLELDEIEYIAETLDKTVQSLA